MPVQAAFCNACGTKMAPASPAAEPPAGDAQLCPACGAASPKGNRFCIHCGAKFRETENETENQEG